MLDLTLCRAVVGKSFTAKVDLDSLHAQELFLRYQWKRLNQLLMSVVPSYVNELIILDEKD